MRATSASLAHLVMNAVEPPIMKPPNNYSEKPLIMMYHLHTLQYICIYLKENLKIMEKIGCPKTFIIRRF